MTTEQLAEVIMKTVTLREASFNHEEERFLRYVWEQRFPGKIPMIDYKHCYHYNLEESALQACKLLNIDERMARLIDLALDGWWNDVIAWAEEVV